MLLTGLQMLPNLKFVVGGILFCLLLFTAAGTGSRLPASRTRIGEIPEVGRPMIQRSIAEAQAQAQVYIMVAARRGELDRLREHGGGDAAAAESEPSRQTAANQPAPNPGTPNPMAAQSDVPGPGAATLVRQADALPMPNAPSAAGAPRTETDGTASVQALLAEFRQEPADGTDNDTPANVAALAPPAADDLATIPPFENVPLPKPRPVVFGPHRHAHAFLRRPRLVQRRDAVSPALTAGQPLPPGQWPAGQWPPTTYIAR